MTDRTSVPRAAASDIERLLEDAIPRPSTRPAAVLLVQGNGGFRVSAKKARTLDRSLEGMGLAPLAACPTVHYDRLVARRMPSDVAWTHYPIVGGPYWRAGAMSLGARVGNNDHIDPHAPGRHCEGSIAAIEEIRQAPMLVYAAGAERNFPLGMHRLLDLLGQAGKPVYWLGGNDEGDLLVPMQEAMDHAAEQDRVRRPLDRFLWSYAANFAGLGLKAMKLCGARAAVEDMRGLLRGMMHPWAVQVLFALRRMQEGRWEGGPVPPCYPSVTILIPGSFPGMVYRDGWYNPGLGCVEETGPVVRNAQGMTMRWPGTGRWPVLEAAFSPWDDVLSFERACHALVCSGLARLPEEDAPAGTPASPTETGLRLLEVLPPAMEDPDVMLRWRGGEGGLPRDEDVPAMDRWVNDIFRKLKRRLAEVRPVAA